MARMTPEDIARLPQGTYVHTKCDHCGKPITSCLTYRGVNNGKEYCSNACFEAAEGGSRGKIQPKGTPMIDKKKTQTQAPEAAPTKPGKDAKNKADAPKADKDVKKVKKSAEPEPEPKKAKKGTPEPEPERPKKAAVRGMVTKLAKKAEAEAEAQKKGKDKDAKAKPAKAAKKGDGAAKETPYRAGSGFEAGFKRLMSGKAMTLDQMFEGTKASDPSRMIAHMIRRGDESGEFKIVRLEDGKVQMTKVYGR